jgi:hypothetical protein
LHHPGHDGTQQLHAVVVPGGDYFVARYTAVRVNRQLPSSTFQIPGAKDAKRVKMN